MNIFDYLQYGQVGWEDGRQSTGSTATTGDKQLQGTFIKTTSQVVFQLQLKIINYKVHALWLHH